MNKQEYKDERRAWRFFWIEAARLQLQQLGQIFCSHLLEEFPRRFSLDYYCYACNEEWHIALPEYELLPFSFVLNHEMDYFRRGMIQRCPHAEEFFAALVAREVGGVGSAEREM